MIDNAQLLGGVLVCGVVGLFGYNRWKNRKINEYRRQLQGVLWDSGVFHEVLSRSLDGKTQIRECKIRELSETPHGFSANIVLPIGMPLRMLSEKLDTIGLCFNGNVEIIDLKSRIVKLNVQQDRGFQYNN